MLEARRMREGVGGGGGSPGFFIVGLR